jgi:hypothetical protein
VHRALVRTLVLAVAFVSLAPRAARGQYNVPRQTTHDTRSLEEPCLTDECWCGRSQCSSYVPSPPSLAGSELGASVDLVMASEGTAVPPLDLLDLAVLRIHWLVNVGRRAELFGGFDVLLAQPGSMDESRWQRALVGVRARATSHVAGHARVQLGDSLDGAGLWGQVEAAAELRVDAPRFWLSWDSVLGGTYTRSPTDTDHTVDLAEVLAQTGLVLRARRSGKPLPVCGWWSLDFHVPVIDLADGHDPRLRVGMSQGMLVALGGGLDIFIEQVASGRGDRDDAATILPNLFDGFPILRWRVGFNRRFGTRRMPDLYPW